MQPAEVSAEVKKQEADYIRRRAPSMSSCMSCLLVGLLGIVVIVPSIIVIAVIYFVPGFLASICFCFAFLVGVNELLTEKCDCGCFCLRYLVIGCILVAACLVIPVLESLVFLAIVMAAIPLSLLPIQALADAEYNREKRTRPALTAVFHMAWELNNLSAQVIWHYLNCRSDEDDPIRDIDFVRELLFPEAKAKFQAERAEAKRLGGAGAKREDLGRLRRKQERQERQERERQAADERRREEAAKPATTRLWNIFTKALE